MKIKLFPAILALLTLTSCIKESNVEEYYLNKAEATITVKHFESGPIEGARVNCQINGTTYGYDTDYQGIAMILFPIIHQPGNYSEFPKNAHLTITHPDYQTETLTHSISYEKYDTYINGNTTTHYYKGHFVQTFSMKLH